MSYFLLFLIALLILVIVFQLFKTNEYLVELIGAIKFEKKWNKLNASFFLLFLLFGLIGVLYCNDKLKEKILGVSASEQGVNIDKMIYVTLTLTLIVFFITQILLFWFVFKYRSSEKRKSFYFTDSTKLELIWTIIPAIVLTVIVSFGIYYWINITSAAPKDAQIVEVTGKQFGWEFRYPGKDGILGKKYFKNIDEANNNPLGQIWDDPANKDDIFVTQEMHVVVGKPVHLIIGSQDVIHDVGLVHFRMKMDAVPGTPTTMWFTPRYTTEQMKTITGNRNFAYEISCDQMCGIGHSKMRGVIVVESQEDYNKWIADKKPQYQFAMEVNQPAPIAQVKTDSIKTLKN
jgi:cytochrome c oxidase subunit II